ncbi:MAG: hypothetical protein J6I72_00680 [Muribaculaceae bacterium]|nr:hypothetical protein [Muribaculaceae bacterium]
MAATNELLMNQAHEIDKLRALQDDNDFVKTLYAQLSAIFEQNIKSLGEIASDYFQSGKNASLFMNRFSEQFKMLLSSNEVWEQIETQVNKTHNNCISRLIQIHPNLSIEERHLAMLSVLNFSSIATAICLGYKGPNVVYTKKSNLKKKLEINCSIEDYLNQLG